MRAENSKDGVTDKDIVFKSLSTAACFVLGTSSNGMIRWKNEEGIVIKIALQN